MGCLGPTPIQTPQIDHAQSIHSSLAGSVNTSCRFDGNCLDHPASVQWTCDERTTSASGACPACRLRAHYCPTKADLLRAAAGQSTTFVGEVHALLSEAEERSAREVLGDIVLGWIEAIRHQESLVTMLVVESQSNEELGQAFRGVVGELVDTMAAYLRGRVAAGELRADLPTGTSAMLFFSSLVMFFLTNRHLESEAWHRRALSFTAEMLDTWFRGSLAPASPGEGPPLASGHGGGG